MALTATEVADLLTREGSGAHQDETPESAEAVQRRVRLLAPVLDTCQHAWQAGSLDIDLLAEKLGDGSRDVAWRKPYGESGILDLFISAVAMDGLRPGLHLHALRIVGNSCADTDENRARVVQGGHLSAIMHRLQDESLIPFTIPVLYNILVDYEPAQKAASEALLNQNLITLLQSPNLPKYSPFVTYFCKILALLASQDSEPAVAHPHTISILLGLALQPPFSSDLEDFISLASTGAAYLAGAQFQEAMASGGSIGLLLDVFRHAHTAFDLDTIEDSDTADALKQLRVAMLTTLSDVSGNDSFLSQHPLDSPVPQTLMLWLGGPNNALRSASCLILGNLARSDESAVALVQTYKAHEPLITLLSNPEINDSQVLHSALSFLKNLAIPAQNKEILGDLAQSSCVPRILSLDTLPQVHFSAISLTRLLLVNCPANVGRICSRRSDDVSSPSHDRSSVHNIISLFERTDAEPTKLEAARSIAAICRVLHSNPVRPILPEWDPDTEEDKEDESKRREQFYSHHKIGQLLAFLVSQEKWPILRSEAWFVFALLSRSKDGAGLVLSILFFVDVTAAVHKAISGREYQAGDAQSDNTLIEGVPSDGVTEGVTIPTSGVQLEPQQVDPKQKDQMTRIDRENCVVLCTELLRNLGDELPQMRISMCEDLIKEGTEILAREKAQG